jgi:hypothetical protein
MNRIVGPTGKIGKIGISSSAGLLALFRIGGLLWTGG